MTGESVPLIPSYWRTFGTLSRDAYPVNRWNTSFTAWEARTPIQTDNLSPLWGLRVRWVSTPHLLAQPIRGDKLGTPQARSPRDKIVYLTAYSSRRLRLGPFPTIAQLYREPDVHIRNEVSPCKILQLLSTV